MATTKKTASKKPTAKKTTAQKATVKKTTPKQKPTSKSAKVQKTDAIRSFRIHQDTRPFTSFRITRQTIYWIILVCFIIFVQLWILKLQIEVATLLDAQATQLQQL